MVKIEWTEQSRDELKEIFDYISRDSKRYAANQIRRIKESTKILKSYIESGRIVPEIGIKEIRELIDGNYRIIYRIVSSNNVQILTIHHSARDFGSRKLL